LTGKLAQVHKKWDAIHIEIDMRALGTTLQKIHEDQPQGEDKVATSRVGLRLFGEGGALHKIMRDTYIEGKAKLEKGTFESKEAKAEWQDWVKELSKEELQIVSRDNWE